LIISSLIELKVQTAASEFAPSTRGIEMWDSLKQSASRYAPLGFTLEEAESSI